MHLQTPNTMRSTTTSWLPDDQYSFFLTGIVWVLIVLMIVPDGFDYQSLSATTDAPSSGGTISRALWLGLLLFSALIIFWRGSLAWLQVRMLNPFLLLLAMLAVASVAWSIDPSLTVRRLVRMNTILLVGIAFVLMGWRARRYQEVVRPMLTLMLLGSIVFGVLFPKLAIHQETSAELLGAWRGLANHKNGLGGLSSITLILWFHAWLARESKFLPALAGILIAAACLILSRSSTSLAATLFVMGLLLILVRTPESWRPYIPYLVATLVAMLLVYALAILNLIPGWGALMAPISSLTGKDVTLTGRTDIWAIVSEHISQHPLLGTGYGAYWTSGPVVGTDAYVFVERMNEFYPGSAHNGYLEIVNDLGWAGLLCLIAYIATYVRQSLLLMSVDRNQGALYLALFFQQAITNLSESHWFSVLSVDFVIMTLATMALARALLEYRLRMIFGEPRYPAREPVHGLGLSLAQKTITREGA